MKLASVKSILALVLALGSLGGVVQLAHARTQPASFGMSSSSTTNCYIWTASATTPGLFLASSGCSGAPLMLPVIWDTAGAKTLNLVARQTAAGQVNCAAQTFNASGLQVSTQPFPAFATNGTYSMRAVSIPSVPAGGTSTIQCQMFSQSARILLLNYNQ
jgi:hypothetical protein